MGMSERRDAYAGGPDNCTEEDKKFYTVFAALLDHRNFLNRLSQRDISDDEIRQAIRERLRLEIPEDELIVNLRRVIGLAKKTTEADFYQTYGKIRC